MRSSTCDLWLAVGVLAKTPHHTQSPVGARGETSPCETRPDGIAVGGLAASRPRTAPTPTLQGDPFAPPNGQGGCEKGLRS